MAPVSLGWSWGGIVLTLNHDEAQTVANAEDGASAFLGLAAGLTAPAWAPVSTILGIVAAWLTVEKWLLGAVDQGNGVYLTLPWPAIWWGQWWIIIPTSR